MKYFTFAEFERSETAQKRKIDNTIPNNIKPNIVALVDNVLDPLRTLWGKPLIVNSGYRCPALNKVLKGSSKTSQHMSGQAADIDAGTRADNKALFHLLINSKLSFDQLIFEEGDIDEGPDWLHISYKDVGRNRRQISYKV